MSEAPRTPSRLSRREFFRRVAVPGVVLWTLPRVLGAQPPPVEEEAGPIERQALNEVEWRTTEALAGRILPGSPRAPGAIEAGAVVFIDRALAGDDADRLPLYQGGLRGIEAVARLRHGAALVELLEPDQDEILAALESGVVEGWPEDGPPPAAFFRALRRHVIFGFLADPSYGGNRRHAGWRVAGYPGPLHHVGAKVAPPLSSNQLVGAHPIVPIWDDPRIRARFL